MTGAVAGLGASGIVRIAGTCALAGSTVAVCVLVALDLAPTGLSPLRNAVSEYGISAHRVWYRVLTISMGVAGGAIALALAQLPSAFGGRAVVALVTVFAACRLAISWVPMDARGSPRTWRGGLHALLAAVTFATAAAAAIRLCRVLEHDPRLDLLARTSRALGWLMAALFAVLLVSRLGPELRRYVGATERALYAAILAWLVVVGIACASGHL